MSNKEHKKYADELKKYLKREMASKESARQFFMRLGTHTKSGKLTRKYSQA